MVIESLRSFTKVQLCMTKRPSRKVMNFRHLLGCDTIVIVERGRSCDTISFVKPIYHSGRYPASSPESCNVRNMIITHQKGI